MEDKKLTEKESLEVITSMIARTKARYLGSGDILLMWGYLYDDRPQSHSKP